LLRVDGENRLLPEPDISLCQTPIRQPHLIACLMTEDDVEHPEPGVAQERSGDGDAAGLAARQAHAALSQRSVQASGQPRDNPGQPGRGDGALHLGLAGGRSSEAGIVADGPGKQHRLLADPGAAAQVRR
jgi:hypothetical protein